MRAQDGSGSGEDLSGDSTADAAPEATSAGDVTDDAASAGDVVLRVLRIALHVGFAVLLTVGVIRTLFTQPHTPAAYFALALAAVLGVVYLAGTMIEKRSADGHPPRWMHHRRRTIHQPRRYGTIWLAVVTGLWVLLLVISGDFSWLAFPLFFLHIHLLGPRHSLAAVVVITAAVITAQWYHAGTLHVAMVLGPLFGAGFAVVMAIAYRSLYNEGVIQQRALTELRRTRAELSRSQHEAGVLAERERLAREIHDTLAQGLSSIVLVSRAADAALDAGDPGTARERILTIQTTASENLREARGFVRGLNPASLRERSLVQSLQRACESTEREAAAGGQNLRCRFELDGDPVPLPAPYDVALLRAAQASLANVALHAGASTAVVTLGFVGPEVTLDVFDDGSGFDAAAALSGTQPRADGSGYGLLSIRERVSALGGTLSIESAPGDGTVLAVQLPLEAPGSGVGKSGSGAVEPGAGVEMSGRGGEEVL